MAASWTMLNALGIEGYIEGYIKVSEHSMRLREELIDGVLKIPGLKVVEGGKINLTGIYSEEIDLTPVSKALLGQEWMHVVEQGPKPITLKHSKGLESMNLYSGQVLHVRIWGECTG